MERKNKVNDSAERDPTADGARSKEVALEKLRKMEWKRNKQDTWHLSRTNSRSNEVQERKKYNKDDDNYFEGTGSQKTKKLRRPRLSENTPAVPPGFCVSQASPAPPQVNAWTQKKGSALFHREDEIDEEDQLLKLALQESLKSAEEDKKRRLERLKMTNLDLPESTHTMCAEKDWDHEFRREDLCTKPGIRGFDDDFPKEELNFVETDAKEETSTVNQRHRSKPPRTRKTSPREKLTLSSVDTNYDPPESNKKVPSPTMNKNIRYKVDTEVISRLDGNESDNDDIFEPSRPQARHSKAIDKVNETASSLSSHVTSTSSNTLHRSSMKHATINSDELSTSFNTTLTFGDTHGLFEKIKEDSDLKHTGGIQNLQNEVPSYLTTTSDIGAHIKSTNPCEPSETDILVHSFLRHGPPSNLNSIVQSSVPDMSAIKQSESNNLFLPISPTFTTPNMNSLQSYVTHQIENTEQHTALNGSVSGALPGGIKIANGRDSSSSFSESPLQNITPYGSLENDYPSNVKAGAQVPSQIGNIPYPYPYSAESNQESLTRHLQTIQLMNQNLSSAINMEYASVPTQLRGVVPVNPQVGQPQYRLPNSNMMVPSPLLLQHQLQQAHMQMQPAYLSHMLALDTARRQQSQLATGIAESDGNSIREQANINQSQIQNGQPLSIQNPNQILTQNQPHMFQLQNNPQILLMQNQSQTVPLVDTSTPKQEELLQQHVSQGMRAQSGGKTKEELQIEYQNVIQALRRVHEEMQEAQVQPPIPMAQPQPAWGVVPPSPSMPLAVNQFFPIGMIPQVHPHLMQQVQNTGLISPSIQHNVQNLGSEVSEEVNSAHAPPQATTELKVGRGRGRLV